MEYDEPTMNHKEKKDLALTEIVLIVLAVIGLGGIIWVAWIKPSNQSKATVNSYNQCVEAGNPVQLSYPEVCVTPEGRRFTNPDR
jgi:hypothetical protein